MVMGTYTTSVRVLICLQLSEYLADRHKKEASLLKEERKRNK